TIQEPARVQAVEQAPQAKPQTSISQETATGATNYCNNCICSKRKTKPTEPLTYSTSLATTATTTIPILIQSQPKPRILLIRVPTSNSSNSSNSSNPSNRNNSNPNGAEHRAPRTRVIRIPFLPGSVPTRPPSNQARPSTSSLVNLIGSATPITIATYPTTGTATSRARQPETMAGLPTTAMVNQTVPVSNAPPTQTLASLAGIQLTGAEEPPSRRDMSGAMPTATVEEIDVPVFIDEYLQDIEATSSTCSSENGKEIFTETDILDFDINMFAEDHIELVDKMMDPYSPAIDGMNNDNLYDDTQLTNAWQLAAEEEATLDMNNMVGGDGVDFSNPEYDLSEILTGSQNPMFSSFSQPLSSTSSTLKIITEEPMLSQETDIYYGCSQESLGFGLEEEVKPSSSSACSGSVDLAVAIPVHIPISMGAPPSLKRSAPAVESVVQKRSRLVLNINQTFSQAEVINTPDVIEQVLDFERLETATPTINTNASITTTTHIYTQADIEEDLRSVEEETTTDFSAPNTPHSSYSVSSATPTCQTGFGGFLTAPASPAFSVASTSQFSTSASGSKRRRGRPAKEHADGPDPELMSRMTNDELKAYQDRIKNNEASRISRRKTKKREEEEKQEEDELVSENQRLHAHHDELALAERKFKKFLMERQRKNSTYVKQEQH
ncbi:hypothetical protein KR009_008611, partial [Drosophila setifemur]